MVFSRKLIRGGARWLTGINGDLALLLAAQTAFALPYLLNWAIPHNDTMHVFNWFAFFYNEAFWHGTLPRWLPFGFYGIQSDYFPTHLSPANYLVGLVGLLLRAENLYALFKISLWVEQIILLLGIYWLSRDLFAHRETVLYVCLSVIGSKFLMYQLFWNFRAAYLLPLVLFLILRGLGTRRPLYLALGALSFTTMHLGNVAYLLPANISLVSLFIAVLAIGNYRGWREQWQAFFKTSRAEWAMTGLTLGLTALLGMALFVLFRGMRENVVFLAEGREPLTGTTDLQTFLTYGPGVGPAKFRGLLDPTPYTAAEQDLSLYAGFSNVALAVFGMVFSPNAVQTALLAAIAVLGLASLGPLTPVAKLLYYTVPGMKWYRHVGYLVFSYPVLVPLLAGYGFEILIRMTRNPEQAPNARKSSPIPALGLCLCGLLGAAMFFYARGGFYLRYGDVARANEQALRLAAIAALLLIGVFLLTVTFERFRFGRVRMRWMSLTVLSLTALDLACYQWQRVAFLAPYSAAGRRLFAGDAIRVRSYEYQRRRTATPPHPRADAIASVPVVGVSYAVIYNWMQWDPVMPLTFKPGPDGNAPPPHRVDFVNRFVLEFIEAFNGSITTWARKLPDPAAYPHLGWETDKLSVVAGAVWVASDEECLTALKRDPELPLVLIGSQPDRSHDGPRPERIAAETEVLEYQANRIVVRCRAPEDRPCWLYYAEAWHPDWRAWVNGKPAPVLRANYAFKAVPLEPGQNIVRMVFGDPCRTAAGYVIAFLGASFAAATLVFFVRDLGTSPPQARAC